jgi:hypothetical protein
MASKRFFLAAECFATVHFRNGNGKRAELLPDVRFPIEARQAMSSGRDAVRQACRQSPCFYAANGLDHATGVSQSSQNGARAGFSPVASHFDEKGADMTMVFVPQHERFQFATCVSRGLRTITVVVDLMSMMKTRGLPVATLPDSFLHRIQQRQTAMETLVSGQFGAITRKCVNPSLVQVSAGAFMV